MAWVVFEQLVSNLQTLFVTLLVVRLLSYLTTQDKERVRFWKFMILKQSTYKHLGKLFAVSSGHIFCRVKMTHLYLVNLMWLLVQSK